VLSPSLDALVARLRLEVNLRLPDKRVRRTVRGVEMVLPRRHGLPIFARPGSPYAENLVDMARLLAAKEGRINVLDIGANVGDSALFVLDQVDAFVVCVEPDPQWLSYLEDNVGSLDNVAIEPSVLVGPEADTSTSLAIVHEDVGTSHVARVSDGGGLSTIATDELVARHPQLADVRLVKSDTDGYDVMLVPALARTFLPSRPVIFFEFDPRPTAEATPELEPNDIWDVLVGLGYEQAVVWDNGGALIGAWPTTELTERSAVLDLTPQERGYGFWDVAVAHKDDAVGLHVLAELSRPRGAVPRQRGQS
jgi:FkbM family methyltransferase